VVLGAGATLLVISAVFAAGFPVRHVDLNDGGVWVATDVDGLFARLNKPAGALDAAINPPGGVQAAYTLDVAQEGAAVAAWDQASGRLYAVDVNHALPIGDPLPVPGRDAVEIGGGTIAVLNPDTGTVWAGRVDTTTGITSLSALDSSARPVAAVGVKGTIAGAALAVGTDGTVYAVSAAGRIATVRPNGSTFGPAAYSSLGRALSSVVATAVGSRLVVADPDTGTVIVPGGGRATVGHAGAVGSGVGAVLQQPGPAADSVVIETPTALLTVGLSDGAIGTLFTKDGGMPANPVRLDDCVHAVWGGSGGGYARTCDGGPAAAVPLPNAHLIKPVFRVNRDSIVLNDVATGNVWDLNNLKQVGDWDAVKPLKTVIATAKPSDDQQSDQGRAAPPKAVADNLGARPGRTTLLHVLDNDSDPDGSILAVTGVTPPDSPHAHLTIAPDGQTIAITVDGPGNPVHFSYTVSNGVLSSVGQVTVTIRTPDQNTAPRLSASYRPRTWAVTSGGRVDIPVLENWRDDDGDPIAVTDLKAKNGTLTATPDGLLDYIAPVGASTQTLEYKVTDGLGNPADAVDGSVTVDVQAPNATDPLPATAQPDVAKGQVGQPISIHPLDNDFPGSDPIDPNAKLRLAGEIASPTDTIVATSVADGTVTVTATQPGTYHLTYGAAYGSAKIAAGAIRIDVDKAQTKPPVAMPDTAVLHGQIPATVDVLANDFDPSGGVLVVQSAKPHNATGNLQVGIVAGHWLRLSATDGTINDPQVVDYTITDGVSGVATGQVTVTELSGQPDTRPSTVDDQATVRAGDEVTVPVLDNDSDPAGAPLALAPNVPGAPGKGQLQVTGPDGATAVGTAYVDGNVVRYVPPATVPAPLQVTIDYLAVDADGSATGHLNVTVNPAPTATDPDLTPLPQPVEARAVAGQTITIGIPTDNVDPDGDTVTVSGIGKSPTLGRILRTNATSLTYQAYPTSVGTDQFTYVVTDRYGQIGTASVRIGIVQPGIPQAPVAVDDVVTASPGTHLRVNVLANDLIAPGDMVTIQPLSKLNRGTTATLDGGTGADGDIDLVTPPADGKPMIVEYQISDGLNTSQATLTVRGQDGVDLPPVVIDAYPSLTAGKPTVTIDLSRYADDPDGDASALTVTKVFDPKATFTARTVTIPVAAVPATVSYQVSDPGGATAVGVVHVPAGAVGAPYVRPGAVIDVPTGGTASVALSDYVVDPANRAVHLTTVNKILAAPADDLGVKNNGDTGLTLTGRGRYAGPAALSIEVTDGTSTDDPTGHIVVLNIPVQVGKATPVLRCPTDPVSVTEGGDDVAIDVSVVCHVWVADPGTLAGLRYTAEWQHQPGNVDVSGSGAHKLTVTAGSNAQPGSTGVLKVGVVGFPDVTATLSVVVVAAPLAKVRPITVDGVKAGKTATVNLADYVNSQLRTPVISVSGIVEATGMPATAAVTPAGGSVVTITPSAQSHGTMTFTLTLTDVPGHADRDITARITLHVLGHPDAPGTPIPGHTLMSKSASLTWSAPADNGAPILEYEVDWAGGGHQSCAASPCVIKNLNNNVGYQFTVRARNLVDWGPKSGLSTVDTPDEVPGVVTGLTVSNPQDGTVNLTWSPAPDNGSPVTSYLIAWSGGHTTSTSLSAAPTGLNNDVVYDFTVAAVNKAGHGLLAKTSGQSAGAPVPPQAPKLAFVESANSSQRDVDVSWSPVDPNGPGPTTYTVTRTGPGGTVTLCPGTQNTSCTDSGIKNDGSLYDYDVTASNAAAGATHTSKAGATTEFEAAATPADMGTVTVTATGANNQATIKFDAPASHGASSTVVCTYNGASCGNWSYPVDGQSNITQTINVLPNGQSESVLLQDCNGSNSQILGAGNACDTPTGNTVVAYGPIGTFQVTLNPNGSGVDWTVSVDPNGHPLQLHIHRSVGSDIDVTTGVTTYSTSGSDNVGYGNGDTVSATVTDTSGGGRQPITVTKSATAPPPPPTVVVSQGAHCGSTCYSSCQSVTCAYIHLVLSNFSGSVTCSFNSSHGGGFTNETMSNGSKDSYDWFGYPGYTVTATCGGVTSAPYTWPNT
jgi:hypothetical protein